MKLYTFIMAFLCLILNTKAQEKTFEKQAVNIAKRIDSITISQKLLMKKELKVIDKKLVNGEVSQEEAQSQKMEIATLHADIINKQVAIEETKLQQLIKDKVDNNLEEETDKSWMSQTFLSSLEQDNLVRDSLTGLKMERRFTSQLVFILGMNTVLQDDHAHYGNGFKTVPFGYGEVGFSFKYRLKEDQNLWNLKAGFSVMFHEIKPDSDNDILVKNGNETYLDDAGFDIKKSTLNIGYISIPIHLELDFSKPQFDKKSNQSYLRSQTGFRMGIGGYVGVRYYTNQVIKYDEDGKKVRKVERDNFNVNTLTFGPSAYLGFKDVSIYAKYDANSIFKRNPAEIHNLSIGLRVDFN
ncbi:hypothetical protein [Mangrovimonas sp. ST2L15]|uniref:hypothetical protein n=1 Tax=Mangrovimonas sp. ST2L15 TaxID=1645916 RepID=UPI0006B5F44E|nr:hypothetical protein [Mangrovimonas sp. ST2L15]